MIGIRSKAILTAGLLALSMSACVLPPPAGVVAVRGARPPRERVEVYGVAPGQDYVWVTGYWRWGGAEYLWVPGYWARPPVGYRRWEAGRWEHRGHGYYWRDGRWRH